MVPEVKHSCRRRAGGCKIQIRGSIWPFQFGLLRDIQQAEAKTTKDQTIRKRMEAAFIDPMQFKPVTALPAGENWTFEIKSDGYRCIAVAFLSRVAKGASIFSLRDRNCAANRCRSGIN